MRISNRSFKLYFIATLGPALVLTFQNCSGVEFATLASLVPVCRDIDAPEVKPVLKYAWDPALTAQPQFNQVMASPAVGDIDHDNFPEIAFVTFTRDSTSWYDNSIVGSALHHRNGVLRVIDGRTGATKFSIGSKALAPIGDTMPLLIDIDGDQLVEIVYLHYTASRVIALNSDGSLRWQISIPSMNCMGGMAAADLDGDGRAEIIANQIVISEGASLTPVIRNNFADSAGGRCTSFAASLNPAAPNFLSIVTHNSVYNADGSLAFNLVKTGYNASADLRPEIPGLEIVQSGNGRLTMYNGLTGALIFEKDLTEHTELICPKGVGGGAPTIGDFRGDGSVQIAVATGRSLTIFDNKGNKIAGSPTKDCSSLATGITSYDFNGDGKPEIVYGDENYLRIYNMSTAIDLIPVHVILNPSGTLLEYPVVADVNGDHKAELVVVANDYGTPGLYLDPAEGKAAKGITGLRVFEPSEDGAWMPTRSVWNQYSYFVNNIRDGLTATPSTISSNDILNRFFRRNTQGENESLNCRAPANDK